MVKEYTKRVIICMVGLALCGLGSALGVLAGMWAPMPGIR